MSGPSQAALVTALCCAWVFQAWKEQHAFDYVKAPAGKIKVQQALSSRNNRNFA